MHEQTRLPTGKPARRLAAFGHIATLLAIAAAGIVHVARALHLLGGTSGLLSPAPLLEGDYSLHGYYCLVRPEDSRWQVSGYDPHFMAGYPKTAAFPTSSIYYELLTAPFGPEQKWAALKGAVLLATVLPILVLPATARVLWGSGTGLIATLFVLSNFWLSQPEEFVRVGLASWLAGATVAVATLAAVARLLNPDGKPLLAIVATLGSGMVALYAHLLSAVVLGLGAAGMLLVQLWRPAPGRLVLAAIAGAACLAVSAPLWYPALDSLQWIQQSGVFYVSAHPWQDLGTLLLAGSGPAWLVLLLACLSPWVLGKPERTTATLLLSAGLVLLSFAYLGSAVPVAQGLQPVRFQAAAVWVLSLPASVAARELLRSAVAGGAGRALGVATGLICLRVLLPGILTATSPTGTMAQGLAPEHRELVRWIRQHTTDRARVLVEDISGLDSLHTEYPDLYASPAIVVLRQRIAPLLPVLTGRVCYGGLYYPAYLAHAALKCGNGRLFGRRAWTADGAGLTRAELSELVERYNVGWAVVWSPPARRLLRTYGDLCRSVATIGPYEVFEFVRAPSYCLSGQALVRLAWNRIVLRDVVPDAEGNLLLSLHWDARLEAADQRSVSVEPYRVPGDPVPFVRVRTHGRPPETITLRWRAW